MNKQIKLAVGETQAVNLLELYSDTLNYIFSYLTVKELCRCQELSTQGRECSISMLSTYCEKIVISPGNISLLAKYCRNLVEISTWKESDIDCDTFTQILDNNQRITSILCGGRQPILDVIAHRVPLMKELELNFYSPPFGDISRFLALRGHQLKRFCTRLSNEGPNLIDMLQHMPNLEDLCFRRQYSEDQNDPVDLKYVFEKVPNLTSLEFPDSVSSLVGLEYLSQLSKLHFNNVDIDCEEVFTCLYPNLTYLKLSMSCGFDFAELGKMCPALVKLDVRLFYNGYKGYADMLKNCKKLESVDVIHYMGEGDEVRFSQALVSLSLEGVVLPRLSKLTCSVSLLGAYVLSSVCPNLEKFQCSFCMTNGGDRGAEIAGILKALVTLPNLREFGCAFENDVQVSLTHLGCLMKEGNMFPKLRYLLIKCSSGDSEKDKEECRRLGKREKMWFVQQFSSLIDKAPCIQGVKA